jgi:hypothetical protein
MPTTIENFFTRAAQKQFSRDFLFRIKQITIAGLQLNGEDDLIYARSASLPGRNIENKQVKYSGQNFNVPGASNYPNSEGWSVEFYVDQNLELRTKLEAASRRLFNNETTTGQICMPGPESTITLDVLSLCSNQDATGQAGLQIVKTIQLVGASIRDIGDIQYQIAEGTGEILNFSTTFAFHFYRDFSK